MRKGTLADKDHALSLLQQSFDENPTVTALSRKKGGEYYIQPLLEYAFYFSLARDGIYFSDNDNCVAFFNRSDQKGDMREIYYLLRLLVKGVDVFKIPKILRHLKNVKKLKNAERETYYHFWFLGSTNSSSDVRMSSHFIWELLKVAEAENVPVYAETTLKKNSRVFTRFGLELYHELKNENLGIHVYMMKKP